MMKFAICNELYGDWSFDKAFAHAAQTGYTGVEIAPFTMASTVFDITPEMRRAVRQTAEKHQLEIIGLHWLLAKTTGLHLTSPDPTIRKKTFEYLGELAKLCRDLGGDVMVFGSPPQRNLADGVTPSQGFEFATEVFRSLAPTLESYDVTLALEPLGPEEGNFMLTAEETIKIAQAVGSPNVRLHLDVKAMSAESIPIPEIIRDSRDWIHHFHANDPNRRGPGMGDVDYVPIFEALKSINYDGWVSVEVFDYQPGVDALAGDSLNYMKRVLGD